MSRRLARPAAATAAALLAVTALAACGSDDDSAGGWSSEPNATSSATSSDRSTDKASGTETAKPDDRKVIEVTMTGGKVSPPPGSVEVAKGTKVRIRVTRDTDGEIHVHGLKDDLHAHAHAGEPVNLDFVADTQGSFEVEAHDPDRSLLTLQVR